MKEITPGVIGEAEVDVTPDTLASKWGSGAVAVFSTPALVGVMEAAAAKAVEPYLEDGETTVGASVNIAHLAPTPPGLKVKARATLIEAAGRKMVFKVEAWDDREKVGEGTHERFVVDRERFISKAKKKVATP
ncbi:MAG: thioesterase family protein [Firmicutes bacterium]|nr:thioesterase family protein [Candidatus Fermentithermobacillaceae bacterium]